MARRYMRRRRSRLGQTEGFMSNINWKSPWVWGGALAAVGLVVMLWPKKAKASTKKADPAPDAPAGSATGAEQTTDSSSSVTISTDPGSGVAIAGPTGPIVSGMKRTVLKGESWSNIASRTYGDYRWWVALWDYNRSGGTKFADPEKLFPGDEMNLPAEMPTDAAYKAAIFSRAEADRDWEKAKTRAKKAGKKFDTPRPASTYQATPWPSQSLPPGNSVSPPPSGTGMDTPALDSGAGSSSGGGGSSSKSQSDQDRLQSDADAAWSELDS